jgi:hypothetical protein
MLHISSEDLIDGNTYDGTFQFNATVGGLFNCKSNYIEDGVIPWIYSGCDTLRITNAANTLSETVFFLGMSDTTVANVITMLQNAFDAISFLAGTVAVWNAATNSYDITISENSNLLWSISTSGQVFDKKVDEVAIAGAFSLSARDIDNRPKYLEVFFGGISTNSQATRSIVSDFFISTFDEEVKDFNIQFDNLTTTTVIRFYRPNVINISVPFLLRWDFLFQGV